MIRILIVDDSAAMRSHIRTTLESAHELGKRAIELVDAASGFDALRLLHRGAYGVVLLDIKLPDIEGPELIRLIRQSANHRNIAIVIVSGLSSRAERNRALLLGADAFVAKPFSPEVIAQAILRSLASRESRLCAAT